MNSEDFEVPQWVLAQIDYLSKGILLQEIFQWAGLVVTLFILAMAPFNQHLFQYGLFVVPLNYFAVARSDYLIHRSGAKINAYELCFKFQGNQFLQSKGGSYIAAFDIPIFIGVVIFGKWMSAHPLNDISTISGVYWGLCLATVISIWFATKAGKVHGEIYKVWLQ